MQLPAKTLVVDVAWEGGVGGESQESGGGYALRGGIVCVGRRFLAFLREEGRWWVYNGMKAPQERV